MAPRLNEFGISQIGIGGFFAVTPLFFIIGAIGCQILKAKTPLDTRIIIIIGALVTWVSNILVGPSTLYGLPQNLILFGLGGCLMGLGFSFSFPNCLPEIQKQVNKEFPRGKEFNNNFSSGMHRFIQGIG